MNSYLLLDSCIIEYYLNEKYAIQIQSILQKWQKGVFGLAINQIVFSELIDGTFMKKEGIIIDTLRQYHNIPVTERQIIGSGKLGSIYRQTNITQNISLIDKIIGATSIITNYPIITGNINDYPQPYFELIGSQVLTYKNKLIKVGLVKPDYTILKSAFAERK